MSHLAIDRIISRIPFVGSSCDIDSEEREIHQPNVRLNQDNIILKIVTWEEFARKILKHCAYKPHFVLNVFIIILKYIGALNTTG